ncbi:hypothetical protein [Pseudanabaena sp. UWO311]|uniref:hypothetical protein n=1 Tax=Pseudanabaena sp. UWO311 TaxID=2487337 RepID=UPI0016806AD4|nr:hypothetical protein [Pseudanabaena sp. UWO311]
MSVYIPTIREALEREGYFASIAKSIACQCKPDLVEHCDRDGLFFTCELCLRDVP